MCCNTIQRRIVIELLRTLTVPQDLVQELTMLTPREIIVTLVASQISPGCVSLCPELRVRGVRRGGVLCSFGFRLVVVVQ